MVISTISLILGVVAGGVTIIVNKRIQNRIKDAMEEIKNAAKE